MRKTPDASALQKVFYRPIEAAIRWSDLTRHEADILTTLGPRSLPAPNDFPRWPILRLNTERLFDAMANRDLPYGRQGITHDDPSLLDDPALTIRHVDLKSWMTRFYPDQRPAFLFDTLERHLHPSLSVELVQTLLAEQELLKTQLARHERAWESLVAEHEALNAAHTARAAADQQKVDAHPRSESTYLSIVGGLLNLMLGKSPGGTPYSSFHNTESVISALVAHYQGQPGISERTLWAKFAAARRHLSSSEM
ncbi:hypothetical protein [Paraburkholderia aspalathi]|uniref:Receptor protein-tyrosine kinase n=1 Tax=Paraburkholderia aspalathi TaxID=1324617 RepID=A0A1I7A8F7_9BURK|nr:hypothetical protein [Paraburkholderia aspalathi]SFT71187.1 hypothetical protein SAMN05192563_1003167 [Paraburkholderia aspalathi]